MKSLRGTYRHLPAPSAPASPWLLPGSWPGPASWQSWAGCGPGGGKKYFETTHIMKITILILAFVIAAIGGYLWRKKNEI